MASTIWTEARRKSFIVSTLRNGSRRWPPKYKTLNEAKTEKKVNKKTGRQAQHYACALCQEDFPQKEIQVDHKEPAVDPRVGFVDWNTFIERLFCDKENLQVLCYTCHKTKTKGEQEFSKGERQSKLTPQLKPKKAPLNLKVLCRKRKPTT